MSKDAVVTFFKTLAERGELAAEYSSAVRNAVTDFAARHGFHFTVEELVETLDAEGDELSDADLDAVAGGYQKPHTITQPRLDKYSSHGGVSVPNPNIFAVEEESPQP
jgi:predicted ribosomally synthesized peptide with nif11-like leader